MNVTASNPTPAGTGGAGLRVVQVHWAFPPTTGGVESHVADLSAGLHARGCHVTVVTGEPDPRVPPGVCVQRSQLLSLERLKAADGQDEAALLEEFDQVIRQARPDVAHGHNLHHFSAVPALELDRLSRRYGFGVYHTFHETWPDLLRDVPVYRSWAGNYAVSRHVRDECARRIGFAPTLRPLGIDVTRFATEHPPFGTPGRPTILHPARLLPWKGVHVTVQALAILAGRGVDARLVVTDTARIADLEDELSEYRSQVLALVRHLGLGGSVEMCAVPYSAMPGLYQDADVVVYPTVAQEPYGLVPLEAMAAGRPVVATRSGGIPETVVDGVTGWLVEPGDPGELADRLADVLANPVGAVRMGAAGRDRVVQYFDLERYLDETLDSYRLASREK